MDVYNDKALHNLVNELSVEYFHKTFLHEVRFNHRLRTTGGRYIPAKKMIELNTKYVEEMDESEFIGIIKHELCHYHIHIEGIGYIHCDDEFKALLLATGLTSNQPPLHTMNHLLIYKT